MELSRKSYLAIAVVVIIPGYFCVGFLGPKTYVETHHYRGELKDGIYDSGFWSIATGDFRIASISDGGWKAKISVTNNHGSDMVYIALWRGTEVLWEDFYSSESYGIEKTFFYAGDLHFRMTCVNSDTGVEIIIEEWKSPLPLF